MTQQHRGDHGDDQGSASEVDHAERTVVDLMTHYTYTPHKPPLAESSDELRARIPGWGVDLDPADRPSYPREVFDPSATGARWEFPSRQPGGEDRERSIEHASMTPVFGTAQPMRGVSGVVRRLAYQRYSEGRAAHWLMLIAADRIDVFESVGEALRQGHPDNLVAETGIRAELSHHGLSSRLGQRRADVAHHLLDPVIVMSPWVVGAAVAYKVLSRRLRNAGAA